MGSMMATKRQSSFAGAAQLVAQAEAATTYLKSCVEPAQIVTKRRREERYDKRSASSK
jgi:hypothetical protein